MLNVLIYFFLEEWDWIVIVWIILISLKFSCRNWILFGLEFFVYYDDLGDLLFILRFFCYDCKIDLLYVNMLGYLKFLVVFEVFIDWV